MKFLAQLIGFALVAYILWALVVMVFGLLKLLWGS